MREKYCNNCERVLAVNAELKCELAIAQEKRTKYKAERDAARAEIERLKAPKTCSVSLCEGGIFECQKYDLEAERDRYKAALEWIATTRCAWQLSQKIARDELEKYK
jgi:hypothetical protein